MSLSAESDNEEICYVEEESESASEVEDELWDQQCKIVNSSQSSILGYHLMPTCCVPLNESPTKKLKLNPLIRAQFQEEKFVKEFQNYWRQHSSYISKDFEIISDPFQVGVFCDFLENPLYLDLIKKEAYGIDFNVRNLDLYEFYQSRDLQHLESDYIRGIYNFIKSDVIKWVSDLTGYELVNVSATCSLYTNTDYLLVHDDQRGDRMVAFVLYIMKEGWNETKGGAFQLLDKDPKGHPNKAVRNIYPKNNQLIIFPVTNDSYHQVTEVTTMEDYRLSINGWFHVKVAPIFNTPVYEPLSNGLFGKHCIRSQKSDIDIELWIEDKYLSNSDGTISEIQKFVEENSEISLNDFFKTDAWTSVQSCLLEIENDSEKWLKVGPPNRHNYYAMITKDLPHSLQRFLEVFQSKQFFSLLEGYTDLELTKKKASFRYELQKWTPGSYSLLGDYNWSEKNELDVIVYFGCQNGEDIIGATTQYVTLEDEIQEAFVTLKPRENTLNLVYRDTARFTKYFSKQSKCKRFFVLCCSYSE